MPLIIFEQVPLFPLSVPPGAVKEMLREHSAPVAASPLLAQILVHIALS